MNLQPHKRNNNMNQPVLPESKPTTKEYTRRDSRFQSHMEQRMALWDINEKKGLCLCEGSMPQCRGMPRQGSGSRWGGEGGGFSEGKPGKRITFEM